MAARIGAAHDSDLMLEGIRLTIEADHRFQLCASARCTADLLAMVQRTPLDVVLLSDHLYSADGIDLVGTITAVKDTAPSARLIVLGSLSDGLVIRDLLTLGVSGYLDWADSLCDLLLIAVQTVLLNRPYLSPTALSEYRTALADRPFARPLSREAYRVLSMLRDGHTITDIAAELNTSMHRVYKIRDRLRERFGATTNEQMIIAAHRLLTPPIY